ncbi:hypothetical protein NXS08_05745 [Gleimia sp. 6138-11-ORH1]|uniref:hypothetical protein n=1 Tax=Gleimia sp. 6138-11-ORH1 TaxID=2973937 RepID=UPI0021670A24|nr:hypothetical protein [Gleimia sp. 6138-11-ORH1]MCS4484971.1 hypothetical protein [Gleimia sp. 6138-11-ORH1]
MSIFGKPVSQIMVGVAQELENIYWQSTTIDWQWEGRASEEAKQTRIALEAQYKTVIEQSAEAIFQIAALEKQIQVNLATALGGGL